MSLGKPIIFKQDVEADTATGDIPLPQRPEYVKMAVGALIAGFTERVSEKHGQSGHVRIIVEYVPDDEVRQ